MLKVDRSAITVHQFRDRYPWAEIEGPCDVGALGRKEKRPCWLSPEICLIWNEAKVAMWRSVNWENRTGRILCIGEGWCLFIYALGRVLAPVADSVHPFRRPQLTCYDFQSLLRHSPDTVVYCWIEWCPTAYATKYFRSASISYPRKGCTSL
jgi:hypothetical protein